MTKVNKQAYRRALKQYPDDCWSDSSIIHALRMGYQVGANDYEDLFKEAFFNVMNNITSEDNVKNLWTEMETHINNSFANN